jgi:hypothetical protein
VSIINNYISSWIYIYELDEKTLTLHWQTFNWLFRLQTTCFFGFILENDAVRYYWLIDCLMYKKNYDKRVLTNYEDVKNILRDYWTIQKKHLESISWNGGLMGFS